MIRLLCYLGFIKIGNHTRRYYNARYKRFGSMLKIGDKVWVNPSYNPNNPKTGKSMSRTRFKAIIILKYMNWAIDPQYELCTSVKGGHDAVMNDYLFDRLEKIL